MAIFPRPKKKARLVLTEHQASQIGIQRLKRYDVTIVPEQKPTDRTAQPDRVAHQQEVRRDRAA